MIMKHIIAFVFLVLRVTVVGQTGSVSGSVKKLEERSTEFVNITLTNNCKAAVVDRNASYQIRNINAGQYTVIASFIGRLINSN
jgi:iron complex outermembrane receptor protein